MAAAPVPVRRASGPRLNADERRAEVVDAAIKAFSVGGFAGTSTEEIARLAGVSQPYLFRLYGSKRALFLAAVERCFAEVRESFVEAAQHPLADAPSYDPVRSAIGNRSADTLRHPVLAAIGNRYTEMLRDVTHLRMQLHAYAASSDPEIRAFVRTEFARLIATVSELSGVPASELGDFFAQGMLMNLAAALEWTDADVAWQRMCEGGQPTA